MASNGNPLRALKPLFIDWGARFAVTIHFDVKSASWTNLNAAFAQVRRAVPVSTDTVLDHSGWRVTDSGYVLKVQLSGDNGFDKATRERLEEVVNPRYSAQATARAEVHRDAGRHIGTIVTLSVTKGEIREVDEDALGAIAGVQRVRVDGQTVKFSLSDPTPASVQKLASQVAEMLGVFITRPVAIGDDSPDNALLPAYDYARPES